MIVVVFGRLYIGGAQHVGGEPCSALFVGRAGDAIKGMRSSSYNTAYVYRPPAVHQEDGPQPRRGTTKATRGPRMPREPTDLAAAATSKDEDTPIPLHKSRALSHILNQILLKPAN